MDVRQFMKRKSISDSRGVENISNKRLSIGFQPGLWSRKSRHPTPTPIPGNFDYPTPIPTPTFSSISYLKW